MTLNVQYPGEVGELEPFIASHNAEFVGLLMAYQFRRSTARMGAVNYGTAHTMATPVMSADLQEVSHYYQHLVKTAAIDEESEELYEKMVSLQLQVESMTLQLRDEKLEEVKRTETLIEIDKALVEMERMAEEMKGLSNA